MAIEPDELRLFHKTYVVWSVICISLSLIITQELWVHGVSKGLWASLYRLMQYSIIVFLLFIFGVAYGIIWGNFMMGGFNSEAQLG